MKILFVTYSDLSDGSFGGAKGSQRNYSILKELFGSVDIFQIKQSSSLSKLVSFAFGFIPPFTFSQYKQLKTIIKNESYDVVFLDSSLIGHTKFMKKHSRVIAFFNNCEYDYVDAINKNKFAKYFYRKIVYVNEKSVSKHSDVVICLSKRDARRIKELYKKEADYVIPVSLKDTYSYKRHTGKGYCLLFGPSVYANLEGMEWFSKYVSPFLKCKTLIAGKGIDKHIGLFAKSPSIEVKGFVEDIGSLYSNALCVAIPLFTGAGMKIKMVEALMYGKYVFGTEEAFSGYEFDFEKAGGLCLKPEDFIDKINAIVNIDNYENYYSRSIFLSKYSNQVILSSFSDIFKRLNKE